MNPLHQRDIFLSLFFMTHIIIQTYADCPKVCTCIWREGKRAIDCSSLTFEEIPDNLDNTTQILDFSKNSLLELESEMFKKKKLINLQKVFIVNSKVKYLRSDVFSGLTNLVELDLSHNYIEILPMHTFRNCQSLMKLSLSYNPIQHIHKHTFSELRYLDTLELRNCAIQDIEVGAFQMLHSLEWLFINGNFLKTIPGTTPLPGSLKGIELEKNSWECDCHIRSLHSFLVEFSIPLPVNPVCKSPARLSGRIIKSIPTTELACLPDIAPTSFYLELGEGKNISLLCHVNAKPEASVSWSFEGQMLQNNSQVAPGVHLVYYLEEGTENKRSELFIYNANVEDNGTFICQAENAAGVSQSNFTIRIILKEVHNDLALSFLTLEYIIIFISAAAVLVAVILVGMVFLILKCQRNRKIKEKREKNKEITIQESMNTIGKHNNDIMDENLMESTIPEFHNTAEQAIADNLMLYNIQPTNDLMNSLSAIHPNSQMITSPSSLRRYQLEQNPDLINGVEGMEYRQKGDGADGHCVQGVSEMRCVLDAQGYPIDFGLPKMTQRGNMNDCYYRTLPCNRMKRHSAANPINRFSREAEFLSRSVDSAYDYQQNIRYTADGYPPVRNNEHMSLPQDGAPISLPCTAIQWPPCLPANLHVAPSPMEAHAQNLQNLQCVQNVKKQRCASAQTEGSESKEPTCSRIETTSCLKPSDLKRRKITETIKESPDEGYEDETPVA